jgi:hypothetical protein
MKTLSGTLLTLLLLAALSPVGANAQLVNFGYVIIGTYKDSAAILTNPYPYTLAAQNSYIRDQPTDFSIQDGGAPFLVPPANVHKVILRFEPTWAGIRDDTLVIEGTFPGSPLNITLRGTGLVLPVELESFSGQAERDRVLLQWTTASETNNTGFTIQRSAYPDFGSWTDLGFTPGYGTTTLRHSYTFTDDITGFTENPALYYRLKQTDADGKYENSRILKIPVALPDRMALEAYPNPFRSGTAFNISLPVAEHIVLKAYSMLGEEVATIADEVLPAGQYSRRWQTVDLPPGLYYGTLTAGKTRLSTLLICK